MEHMPKRNTEHHDPDGDPDGDEIEHGVGMSRGGRKRRRSGGHAEGHLEGQRLDRRSRKAKGGGVGNTPYPTSAKMRGPIQDVAGEHYSGTRAENNAELPEEKREKRARGGAAFRTPSGSVSAAGRHDTEKKGETMAGGSFPIRNASDLKSAKHDVGRAKNPAAARRWIDKRAHELGEPALGES